MDEIDEIVAGLTDARKDMLCGRIAGWSYRRYTKVGRDLARLGLVRECIGGFFEIAELGLQVRARLNEGQG